MSNWERNAEYVAKAFSKKFVNYEKKYYLCPECNEQVFENDLRDDIYETLICPNCKMLYNSLTEEEVQKTPKFNGLLRAHQFH